MSSNATAPPTVVPSWGNGGTIDETSTAQLAAELGGLAVIIVTAIAAVIGGLGRVWPHHVARFLDAILCCKKGRITQTDVERMTCTLNARAVSPAPSVYSLRIQVPEINYERPRSRGVDPIYVEPDDSLELPGIIRPLPSRPPSPRVAFPEPPPDEAPALPPISRLVGARSSFVAKVMDLDAHEPPLTGRMDPEEPEKNTPERAKSLRLKSSQT